MFMKTYVNITANFNSGGILISFSLLSNLTAHPLSFTHLLSLYFTYTAHFYSIYIYVLIHVYVHRGLVILIQFLWQKITNDKIKA